MTTKQEIIYYIGNKVCFNIDDETVLTRKSIYKIVQMIEDLKPRVPKLKFEPYVRQPNKWICRPIFGLIYSIEYDEDEKLFIAYFWLNSRMGEYLTKEEAQEACQKHYEGSILGAIEF